MILLKDVLKQMAKTDGEGNAIPFSIEYVTHDKKRKKGGKVNFYPEAILCFNTSKTEKSSGSSNSDYKKPKHKQNETRNIEILVSGVKTGEVRKLHILLITKFNNEEVN